MNQIYGLQAIYELNIMTIDKKLPLPTFHSMKSHMDHGKNTVGITKVVIK